MVWVSPHNALAESTVVNSGYLEFKENLPAKFEVSKPVQILYDLSSKDQSDLCLWLRDLKPHPIHTALPGGVLKWIYEKIIICF
jgi:hypothetical protein